MSNQKASWPPNKKEVDRHDAKADPKRAAKNLPYSGKKGGK